MCEPTLHDLEAIALQVLAELRRIRELLERRESGEPGLLAVIHRHVHDLAFTASELAWHARVPANRELRAAIEREFGTANPRRIGKFLSSIAGRPTGDFIVEAVGEERSGVIWTLRKCPGKPALPVAREERLSHAEGSFHEGAHRCG